MSEEKKDEVKVPDFKKLLEALSAEVERCHKLADRIFFSSNTLKRVEVPIEQEQVLKNDAVEEKQPETVVEYLWAEVIHLNRLNQELTVTANHLESVIGK